MESKLVDKLMEFASLEMKAVEGSGWDVKDKSLKDCKDAESYACGYYRGVRFFMRFIEKNRTDVISKSEVTGGRNG